MKFLIWKTSDDYEKPCEKAVLASEKKNSYGWLERAWEVEINSLEELLKLAEESEKKRLIIFAKDEKMGPSIEIYDDYRE